MEAKQLTHLEAYLAWAETWSRRALRSEVDRKYQAYVDAGKRERAEAKWRDACVADIDLC